MMKVVRPEIDEVNEKYKKADALKKQQKAYQAMINDKMGSTLVVGVNGYTPKQPAVVRGIGIVNVNWVIRFEEIYFTRGTYENVGL